MFGGNSSVIDYVVVKKEVMKRVKDVKGILVDEYFVQHRLLVMDMAWENEPTQKERAGKNKVVETEK